MSNALRFLRISSIDPEVIHAHLSDPRVVRHLPLMPRVWDMQAARALVAAKEAAWTRDGLGHWAFMRGETYLGWGGFEREGADWDFGLVLTAEAFGLGLPIARQALDFARGDARMPSVTFLLPVSRRHVGALARLGATEEGRVQVQGAVFRRFRIATPSPRGRESGQGPGADRR